MMSRGRAIQLPCNRNPTLLSSSSACTENKDQTKLLIFIFRFYKTTNLTLKALSLAVVARHIIQYNGELEFMATQKCRGRRGSASGVPFFGNYGNRPRSQPIKTLLSRPHVHVSRHLETEPQFLPNRSPHKEAQQLPPAELPRQPL